MNALALSLHSFSSPGHLLKLPWRLELLRALLDFDLVRFQTERDRRSFLECLRAIVRSVSIRGRGRVIGVFRQDRARRIGAFPISIDFDRFAADARKPTVVELMHRIRENPANRTLLLGVDRLDYTKGIPYRLLAFRDALFRYPQLRRKVTLVQVVVPSRTGISKYRELRAEIERLVGGINGRFARADWVPVHYAFRLLTPEELLAFYRAVDIALIIPLKDGMNLIAKEYCAADVTNNGIVILSEVAGAASQLQMGTLLVNPYYIQAVADAILQAYQMDSAENKARMKTMRQVVRKQNVFWWVDAFLKSAISQDLGSFPYLQKYVRQLDSGGFSFEMSS